VAFRPLITRGLAFSGVASVPVAAIGLERNLLWSFFCDGNDFFAITGQQPLFKLNQVFF
jgi:hypothetical protein